MITTTLTVWCDFCSEWVYLDSSKRPMIKQELKKKSWIQIDNNIHMCPNCVKKIQKL
jgi:hypothetical protein